MSQLVKVTQTEHDVSLSDAKGTLWPLPESDLRTAAFAINSPIKVRPGLIYAVSAGVVRFHRRLDSDSITGFSDGIFVINGDTAAFAHTECMITWCYWDDLNAPTRRLVSDALREDLLQQLDLLKVLHGNSAEILLAFLHYLGQRFGIRAADGSTLIPWLITHQQIAYTINTTRVTVTRMFATLKAEGKIRVDENNLIFLK